MENNLENKAKFFALYYGQKVYRHNAWNTCRESIKVDTSTVNGVFGYLQLAPISSITDHDAIEVAKIACPFLFNTFKSKHFVEREHEHWVSVKHLRNAHSVDIDYNGYIEVFHEDSGYTSNPNMVQAIRKLQDLGYYVGDGSEVKYGWVKLKYNA